MFGLVSPTVAVRIMSNLTMEGEPGVYVHCVNPATKVAFPGIEDGSNEAVKKKKD